jgi:hypothetical protein
MKRMLSALLAVLLTGPVVAQTVLPQMSLDTVTGNIQVRNPTTNANVVIGNLNNPVNASPSSATYPAASSTMVSRTIAAKLQDRIDARDFGVKCDGATDDTAAINTALNAVTGKHLYFPAGICLYSGGGTLGVGTVVEGAGRNATTFVSTLASPTSGYLFNVFNYGAGITNVGFTANVTQTAGSYVVLAGPESFIDNFAMNNDFNGIRMTGNVARIRHGRMQSGAPGATRIYAGGGDNSQIIDDVLIGAQTNQVSRAGIEVQNSSALMITNTSVINQTINLLVDPTDTTLNVYSLYVQNCFFDFAQNENIKIAATGTGSVVRSRFSNVWAGESIASNGVTIINNGTGIIQGLHFQDLHAVLNNGSGVTTGGIVSDLEFNGGEYGQNLQGLYFNTGASSITVSNAHIGNGAGLQPNTNGIVLKNGVSNFTLTGNIITGNTLNQVVDETGSVAKVILGNIGVNNGSMLVGSTSFSPTPNYVGSLADSSVAGISGSTSTPDTTQGAAGLFQKTSSNAAYNSLAGLATKLSTATNARATGVYGEASDITGGLTTFVEGGRFQGTLAAGANGSAYGAICAAGTNPTGVTTPDYLIGCEAEVDNQIGPDAPTFGSFNKDRFTASFLATQGVGSGTRYKADGAFVVNPYSLGQYQTGLLLTSAVSDTGIAAANSSSMVTGIDLSHATLSYATLVAPNNAPIRYQNAARNGIVNVLNLDTNNDIIVGADTPGRVVVKSLLATVTASLAGLNLLPSTYSALPVCGSSTEGQLASVTDASSATNGATFTGGGSNHILGYCNGTNWTVH